MLWLLLLLPLMALLPPPAPLAVRPLALNQVNILTLSRRRKLLSTAVVAHLGVSPTFDPVPAPNRTIPYRLIPYHTIPYHTINTSIPVYYTIPYIIQHLTIPYHTIKTATGAAQATGKHTVINRAHQPPTLSLFLPHLSRPVATCCTALRHATLRCSAWLRWPQAPCGSNAANPPRQ